MVARSCIGGGCSGREAGPPPFSLLRDDVQTSVFFFWQAAAVTMIHGDVAAGLRLGKDKEKNRTERPAGRGRRSLGGEIAHPHMTSLDYTAMAATPGGRDLQMQYP